MTAISRLLLWLKRPRKQGESALRQADGNGLCNSNTSQLSKAISSTNVVHFPINCTITTCSISLTEISLQKMWVMTRVATQELPWVNGIKFLSTPTGLRQILCAADESGMAATALRLANFARG